MGEKHGNAAYAVNTSRRKALLQLFLAAALVLVMLFVGRTTVFAEEVTTEEEQVNGAGRDVPHYTWKNDGGEWDGTYYKKDGKVMTDVFFCDNEFTYYLQKDGTPMTNRLTYHPNGKNIIYFDEKGHEVFDNFVNVKKSIAGDAVNDICYFDTFGYMYVDKITYDRAGVNLYYLNAYGVREQNGWFGFADGNIGFANWDGTLMTNQFSFDQWGRLVYFQGDGKLARGVINDGVNVYQMDANDGHCLGQWPIGQEPAEIYIQPANDLEGGEFVSKKGIQGTYGVLSAQDLNVKHSLYNLTLDRWISDVPTNCSYQYNGKTYYFTEGMDAIDEYVKEANKRGITITFVVLMPWDANHTNMIYPGARQPGHPFYMLNAQDDYLQALLGYLAKRYGKADCHVDNWILGNEVNMPNAYNYSGTVDLGTNVSAYSDAFLVLYNALQRENPNAKAYISLDHSWSHNDEGRGIAGKEYLNNFWAQINQKQANVQWNIAYHLYTPIMQSSQFWTPQYNHYTAHNENADFVSAYNLEVLTDYVKAHFGQSTRIILSEQGFNTAEGEQYQAAALAYTFYAAQFNDMIDAAIFRSYQTDPNDTGFDFGLIDASGRQREAYNVFKYMDSQSGTSYTDPYLSVIGIDKWSQVVPNYHKNVTWK